MLGTFVLGAQRLLPLMQLIYGNWALIIGNLAGAEVVLKTLEVPLPAEWRKSQPKRLPFHPAIVLKDVSFRYAPDQQPVIERFNLTIFKGSKVAPSARREAGKARRSIS